MKGLKQLFLFLIPTLIVSLIYISISQQNTFAINDDNYDLNNIRIESQNKYLTNAVVLLFFYIISKKFGPPMLVLYSGIIAYIISLKSFDESRILKGRSPPNNTFSII